jgi:rsbT co-antagonist protein RsbR
VVHDITQRKQDEAERDQMLKELRRLAAVLDNTSDLVSMADMQGKVLYVNNAGLEMTGRTGQDSSTLSIPDFHPPEVAQRTLDEHVPILMAQGIHSWESEVQHTDGHTIPVSQVSTLIRNEAGEPEAMATIMRDLSEQKQAETERERLQREVIEAQQQALKELATPIIPIMDRIIVLPLIGSIDSMRARDITRTLLSGIGQYRAKIVIIDITGVSLIDSGVANHLNKTIQAARLKGAHTIVTGMSDAVAETIVDLGIDWSEMTTLSDLQTGLIVALDSLGVKLSNA